MYQAARLAVTLGALLLVGVALAQVTLVSVDTMDEVDLGIDALAKNHGSGFEAALGNPGSIYQGRAVAAADHDPAAEHVHVWFSLTDVVGGALTLESCEVAAVPACDLVSRTPVITSLKLLGDRGGYSGCSVECTGGWRAYILEIN